MVRVSYLSLLRVQPSSGSLGVEPLKLHLLMPSNSCLSPPASVLSKMKYLAFTREPIVLLIFD